jgi:DNA-directed RNA polymerase subunit RPC12/RpoP
MERCVECGEEIDEGKEIFWDFDYGEDGKVVRFFICERCWKSSGEEKSEETQS